MEAAGWPELEAAAGTRAWAAAEQTAGAAPVAGVAVGDTAVARRVALAQAATSAGAAAAAVWRTGLGGAAGAGC